MVLRHPAFHPVVSEILRNFGTSTVSNQVRRPHGSTSVLVIKEELVWLPQPCFSVAKA